MIDVAITQWGHTDFTTSLLDTLIESQHIKRISVCDNHSSKTETESLKKYLGQSMQKSSDIQRAKLALIENSVNSGFSLGMNLAISNLIERGTEWVWVLNNDVSVSCADIQQISEHLTNAAPGVFGTSIVEEDGVAFSGSYEFDYLTTRFKQIKNKESLASVPQKYRYISGASMIIHRRVFEDIGLLNQRTFLYFEELDFFSRAREAGYYQQHIKGPVITHQGAGSSQGEPMNRVRTYHETISMLDHYRHHCLMMLPILLLVRAPLKIMRLLLTGRASLISSVLDACTDFLLGKNKHLIQPQKIIETYYKV